MKLNRLYKKLFFTVIIMVSFACDVTDLKPQNSPNSLGPNQYNLDNYVRAVQVNFAEFFETGTDNGMEVTRMLAMGGGTLYENAYSPAGFDNFWEDAYSDVLINTKELIIGAEAIGQTTHAAYGKIIQAYTLVTMADMFGDIPWSEALLGSANLNPNVDNSADIYAAAFDLLEEAIVDLATDPTLGDPATDLFYDNDKDAWTRLANTLKFKMYLQAEGALPEAADSIADLVSRDALLQDGQDFQFNWGTTISAPDSRHPEYGANYDNGGSDYMSNYFMNLLLTDQGIDPRRRYYFYRQRTTAGTDVNQLSCLGTPKPAHYGAGDPYCQVGAGYWGRDHGNDDGIPPDGFERTVWGIYPIGGKFDDNSEKDVAQGLGGAGRGISPIMMVSHVYLMRAEAANKGLTGEDARALLQAGVEESISKVMNFPGEIGYTMTAADLARVPSGTTVANYVIGILTKYDAAATAATKLERICLEMFKAAWGNGFEVYNMYRRTGYPSTLQPTLEPNSGLFIRSFIYPANFANFNQNVDQKEFPGTQERVFWDDGSIVLD